MVIPTRWPAIAVVVMAAVAAPRDAAAQTDAPPGSAALTLPEALGRALTESPRLAAFPYAVRAAEAEHLQAGSRPNPHVSIQLENFAGTGRLSGVRSAETTLMLSQLLEMGGKRERRTLVAASGIGLVEADYEIERLDVLAEVARRFIHAARDEQLVGIAADAVDLAASNREAVSKRVDAARAMHAELNRAEIELARAKISLEHREHEVLSSRRRLAAALGADAVDFGSVSADLRSQPATRPLDDLLRDVRDAPDMARFLSERRVREAELELERARAVPNATVGAGFRRLEGLEDHAFILNFSLEFPAFDRNQGNIAAARERLGQLEFAERTRYLEAQAVLFTTYQELQHARTETQVLNETVIPQSREALAGFEAGYESGRFSYLELADARREFIELRAEAVRTAAYFHTLLVEIERLTGIGFGIDGVLRR